MHTNDCAEINELSGQEIITHVVRPKNNDAWFKFAVVWCQDLKSAPNQPISGMTQTASKKNPTHTD